MAVAREYVKALIDRLTDKQVDALRIIVESMAWPTEEITPEEAAEIEEAFAEIDAGKGVKAEDVCISPATREITIPLKRYEQSIWDDLDDEGVDKIYSREINTPIDKNELIAIINKLPDAEQLEVLNALSQKLNIPSAFDFWDNEDDAAYDNL